MVGSVHRCSTAVGWALLLLQRLGWKWLDSPPGRLEAFQLRLRLRLLDPKCVSRGICQLGTHQLPTIDLPH